MFSATPLTPHTGCEISGLDASRAPPAAAASALARALDDHGVVLLRAQQLDPAQFLAFGRALGELAADLRRVSDGRDPALTLLSNIRDDGAPWSMPDTVQRWRLEGAYLKTPHRATMMYAAQIAAPHGAAPCEIHFANTAAAYDALAPALRSELAGMRAIHPYGGGRKRRDAPYFADSGLTRIFRSGVDHPVVRVQPRSGRRCVYISPATTSHIHGMRERDSDALLAQLYAHLQRPAFVYRHVWRAGDLLLWDNCLIQYRCDNSGDPDHRRLLYRCWLRG